jgi:hypothetical protein
VATEAVNQIYEFIEKVIEKGIEDKLQNLSDTRLDSLEQSYRQDSDAAVAADHKATIQVLVDKARKFTEKHLFYQLNQVTEHALSEIKSFRKLHYAKGYLLPSEVFGDLRSFLSVHERTLVNLREGLEVLQEIREFSEFTKTDKLGEWAEKLEMFGDALEDNIPFFNIETLERLQPLLYDVIKQARKKSAHWKSDEHKKEGFRVRIRNAAGFLVRLIDSLREESEVEDQEIMEAISTANHPVFFEGS